MFSSRALRTANTARWSLSIPLPSPLRLSPIPQCFDRVGSRVLSRLQSTAARQARGKNYVYPPLINIYNQGLWTTCYIGIFRLATVIVCGIGTFLLFPRYLSDWWCATEVPVSEKSTEKRKVEWYWPWVILVGSFLPMLTAFLAFAPMVHHIHVEVPTAARRSKDELMRWARNVPRNTTFRFSAIRFLPWPQAKLISALELRRLPFSRTRLANLEYQPMLNEPAIQEGRYSKGVLGVYKRVWGRYYVSRTQARDKSAVPGVWDAMWEHLLMEGETRDTRATGARIPPLERKPPGPRIAPPRASAS